MHDLPRIRWHVRSARVEDIPELVRFMSTQSPWTDLGLDAEDCRARIEGHLDEIQVAAGDDDAPAGFLRWRPHAVLGQPYLSLLAVAPERHGAGVGRALMRWLEEEVFERRGAANLFLCVSEFNAPARAFYRRL